MDFITSNFTTNEISYYVIICTMIGIYFGYGLGKGNNIKVVLYSLLCTTLSIVGLPICALGLLIGCVGLIIYSVYKEFTSNLNWK